jgi:type VI secretion system protein ImpA
MSSPILNVDELLAPIPGDDPAGQSLPFAVRQELEEARKEINPDDFAEDDPTRPSEAKYADWPVIERLTKQTLTETSKDLLVAARLTEALLRQHGFVGLADGLTLLHRLLVECWDRIYPTIEDGDLEVRAAPLNWLGEAERGARFPLALRATPLLSNGGGSFTWFDWRKGQGGAAVENAIVSASGEECQALVEDLDRAAEQLQALGKFLEEKVGRDAMSLTDLNTAVSDCRSLARQILKRKGPVGDDAEAAEEAAGAEEGAAETGGGRGGKSMKTRADVYARLAEAADLLERLEPHSPIPWLIRKAVELGALPFPKLMQALIRDENVLTEMRRELGLKEESSGGG